MRRAAAVLLGTFAGSSLLIAAKLGTRPPVDANSVAVQSPGVRGSASGTVPSAPALPPGQTPSGGPTSAAPGPPQPGTTTHGAPSQPQPTRPAGGLRAGTFTGKAVTEKYGTIRVTIVTSGGRITNASATYPTSGESGSINNRAIPKLNQETLAAQSANIDTVSGATYTSDAYRTSLQSALDAAKA